MPNITPGFWSKFGRGAPPQGNKANSNLERNVGIYVQSYLKNRNVTNKVPPLNNFMAKALHTYINSKRARVGGAAAAAAGNAGASAPVQANIAAACCVGVAPAWRAARPALFPAVEGGALGGVLIAPAAMFA